MATHSSVLTWRIPGTGELGGLPSMGSHSRTRLKQLSRSMVHTTLRLIESMDAEPWIQRNHIQAGPTVKLQADFNQTCVGDRGGLSLSIVQELPVFLPSFKRILQSKRQ